MNSHIAEDFITDLKQAKNLGDIQKVKDDLDTYMSDCLVKPTADLTEAVLNVIPFKYAGDNRDTFNSIISFLSECCRHHKDSITQASNHQQIPEKIWAFLDEPNNDNFHNYINGFSGLREYFSAFPNNNDPSYTAKRLLDVVTDKDKNEDVRANAFLTYHVITSKRPECSPATMGPEKIPTIIGLAHLALEHARWNNQALFCIHEYQNLALDASCSVSLLIAHDPTKLTDDLINVILDPYANVFAQRAIINSILQSKCDLSGHDENVQKAAFRMIDFATQAIKANKNIIFDEHERRLRFPDYETMMKIIKIKQPNLMAKYNEKHHIGNYRPNGDNTNTKSGVQHLKVT